MYNESFVKFETYATLTDGEEAHLEIEATGVLTDDGNSVHDVTVISVFNITEQRVMKFSDITKHNQRRIKELASEYLVEQDNASLEEWGIYE